MTPQQLESSVKAFVEQGKAIEAMKAVFDVQKCGLKEAKDYIDKFVKR